SYFTEALAAFVELDDRRNHAIAEGNCALLLQEEGKSADALAAYDRAIAALREMGIRRVASVFQGFRGTLHHERGRFDAARSDYEEAVASVQSLGDRRREAVFGAALAALCLVQGRLAEAAARFADAEAVAGIDERTRTIVGLHRVHLDRALGRTAAAEAGLAAGRARIGDSHQVRFALRLLESASAAGGGWTRREREGRARRQGLGARVEVRGWEGAGGGKVDLTGRGALRRMLARLIEVRLAAPGTALSVHELIAAGWPGQRMRFESGA